MMQAWSNYLDTCVVGNVAQIKGEIEIGLNVLLVLKFEVLLQA